MNWRKWLDDFVLAGKGILLATKERRFWIGFIISFLFFGMLMKLLYDGTGEINSIFSTNFSHALKIIGENFLGIFGYKIQFDTWLPIFFISILQGILIGLIVLLWKKKREQKAENLKQAGIITGLIALGAGCPNCGPALLTPLFISMFASSGLAIAGVVSVISTYLAIIIAIFVLKRLGLETYVTIINEKYSKKKEANANGK